jgi:pyruvate/2-oxoglutarate dehydrogenase complex dihydrolipoamide dehydrogenase (E3) component
MSQPESREILILGSGAAGKHLVRHMAAAGHRTAVIERRWIGGSCHNVACLPSKNEIWSARVAHLARHGIALVISVVFGAATIIVPIVGIAIAHHDAQSTDVPR